MGDPTLRVTNIGSENYSISSLKLEQQDGLVTRFEKLLSRVRRMALRARHLARQLIRATRHRALDIRDGDI